MVTALPCYMHGNSPWGRDGKGKDWMRAAHLHCRRYHFIKYRYLILVPGDPVLAVCVRLESTSSVLLRRWQRQHCSTAQEKGLHVWTRHSAEALYHILGQVHIVCE